MATYYFERDTGTLNAGRVREIIFTSRLIGAKEALTAGLISEILPDRQSLDNRALELARAVAGQAPLTLRATRELQRRLAKHQVDDEDMITLCYGSEDFKEGIEAFFDKRKPQWKGK